MPFADTIVGLINESLKGSSLNDKRFQPASYNRLASVIARKNAKGELELVPGSLDGNGNYTPIVPDNKYNLVIYHKIMSNVYGLEKSGYGDDNNYTCATDMMMVVWGDGQKMKLTADQLEAMVVFGIPQMISKTDKQNLGLVKCKITVASSNMDRLQVFRQEFQNVEFFLKPNNALFLVRYRIETSFNQACVDLCCK